MLETALPALALAAAPAAALPPPVEVAPTVVSSPADAHSRTQLIELIERLEREGHVTLRGVVGLDMALDPCWRQLRPDRACLSQPSPTKTEGQPQLVVVIDLPEWRQAAARVRCVGPQAERARSIQLYLDDALADRSNALQEKARLAGCMIGALHGAPDDSLADPR